MHVVHLQGRGRLFREEVRPTRPLQRHFREKVRPARHKTPILSHFSCAGRTFSRVRPRPWRFCNQYTSAATDAGKHETAITSAHPQQGTYETAITSAPKNRTKNTPFSPAKAMAVSTPHRHKRAKATAVSDKRAAWSAEPDHSARGRRLGQSTAPVDNIRYKRRQTGAV